MSNMSCIKDKKNEKINFNTENIMIEKFLVIKFSLFYQTF